MEAIDAILARLETDFDFYLAVRENSEQALASYDLAPAVRTAFTRAGAPLWNVIARHTAGGDASGITDRDGGLPPPPPPFTVTHSVPRGSDVPRVSWGGGFDKAPENAAIDAALRVVRHAASPSARLIAVQHLIETLG